MDLFQAIFAESSSESDASSDTETKTNTSQTDSPHSGGGPNHQMTAASQEINISSRQVSLQRTRWQDFSALTTQHVPVCTKTPVLTAEQNRAETLAESKSSFATGSSISHKQLRSLQETSHNRPSAGDKKIAVGSDTFGPMLPPGILFIHVFARIPLIKGGEGHWFLPSHNLASPEILKF